MNMKICDGFPSTYPALQASAIYQSIQQQRQADELLHVPPPMTFSRRPGLSTAIAVPVATAWSSQLRIAGCKGWDCPRRGICALPYHRHTQLLGE